MVALVKPSFVSTASSQDPASQEPLKALEVVDIYKEKAGNIVTSYTEQSAKELSFLDKLKAGFNLGSVGDYIKDASSLLRTASQGASALASLRMGGLNGLTGGIAGLARMAGVGGIMSTVSRAAQLASLAKGSGSLVNKAMSLANISGLNSSPLNRLIGSSSSVMSSFGGLQKLATGGLGGLASASGFGNAASLLSSAGRLTDTASGLMSSFEGAAGIDYKQALGQVGNFYGGQYTNVARTGNVLYSKIGSGVDTVISSLTGRSYSEIDTRPIYSRDPQGAASLVAGVTLTSVNAGVPGSFARIASEVKDPTLIKNASLPLLDIASKTGSLSLATEIFSANEIAGSSKELFSVRSPAVAANLLKNMTFDASTTDTGLAKARDGLIGLVSKLDPDWNKASFQGKTVMSAQSTRDNPFMAELFQAGVNSSKQATAFASGSGATKPQITEDAFHIAAGHFTSDETKDFSSDKVLSSMW